MNDPPSRSAEDEAYKRGRAEGEIAVRLDGHDRHFASINGSLEEISKAMQATTLALQGINNQMEAREVIATATTAALKAAEDNRVRQAEQRWAPVTKVFAVVAAASTMVSLVTTLFLVLKG